MKTKIITYIYNSPCGPIVLGDYEGQLCLCDWFSGRHHQHIINRLEKELRAEVVTGQSPIINQTVDELKEYFEGKRQTFDIPLHFVGTDFQKKVWQALLDIPYGQQVSYGELARKLGQPTAVRAIAGANGANAISIIVPCHRVVGSNGSLTGYGGGLDVKRQLLHLESSHK